MDNLLDGDLDQGPGVSCEIDSSQDVDSAYEGAFETELEDTLCPASDIDFWGFTTTAYLTPVTDGEHLYLLSVVNQVVCMDLPGNGKWTRWLPSDATARNVPAAMPA